MAYYESFLDKLLQIISHGDDQSIRRIISVIRSGASHRQIRDVLDQISITPGPSGGQSY